MIAKAETHYNLSVLFKKYNSVLDLMDKRGGNLSPNRLAAFANGIRRRTRTAIADVLRE